MKLTAEQQRIVADWVRIKMEHHACSVCQTNHWQIGELLHPEGNLAVDEFDNRNNHGMVQVICQNCGNVLLFDVRRIPDWQQHDTSRSSLM